MFKTVYMLDIQRLDQKWFNFFEKYLDNQIQGNDAAYDLFWDDFANFDCSPKDWVEQNQEFINSAKEFHKMMTDAGIPEDAEVWIKFWW